MKLSTKIYFGFFVIPALILLGIAIYSTSSFQRLDYQVATIYDNQVLPLQQLNTVSNGYAISIVDAVNKANLKVISNTQALQNINDVQPIIKENWQNYLSTILTQREQELAQEVQGLLVRADTKISELKKLLSSTNSSASVSQFYGSLYRDIDPLTNKLQELINLQTQIAKNEREKAYSIYAQTQLFFRILLVFTLLIGSPIGFALSRSILATFKQTLNTVAAASSQIAAATEEHERIATQQVSSVNQTTVTVSELNASSKTTAQQAETAATGAKHVLDLANNGTHIVEKSLSEMARIKQQMGAVQLQISQLREHTELIGNITNLVGDLAIQTNILALNAAIESVRAGEQGKGFALVAGEIRKLADRSRQSANKIQGLVEMIQATIRTTITTTDEGANTVVKGAKISQETAVVFAGVKEAIDTVVVNSQNISLNAQQQAVAIQQVDAAMNALNAAATQTAKGISQTKVGTTKLNEMALELKSAV